MTRELQAVTDTLNALGTATAALTNSFHGSLVGFPASSCGAIREKQAGAADGTYYLKSGREVFRAECKTNGKDKFVSAGGNGKTQASLATLAPPPLPRICSRTLMDCVAPLRRGGRSKLAVPSQCGGLLPSTSADVRSSGDVVAF